MDLYNIPCFIVNLKRCQERFKYALKNISEAGFKNIKRFEAVDAKDSHTLLETWKQLNYPKFDSRDDEFVTYPGKQGCFLSHMLLWKKLQSDEYKDHEYFVIFEDDVFFHCRWKELSPQLWEYSPKDFDLLYLGSQIEYPMEGGDIYPAPVFCTHAYIIKRSSISKIYDLIINDPKGVSTIDCMLINHMWDKLSGKPEKFRWYVWSSERFPDPVAKENKDWAKRNSGFVFQDYKFESDVRQWG